jgi:hypothetical protein
LFRHALLLAGSEAKWQKREIFEAAAERFGIAAAPFSTLIDIREEKIKGRSVDPAALLAEYLREIGKLIQAVDGLNEVTS